MSEAGVHWYVWRSVAAATSRMIGIAAEGAAPAAASFPYGFPKPGACRILVQAQRIFDAKVEN
jgi:hypothetical protein